MTLRHDKIFRGIVAILAALILAAPSLKAQNSTSSPYSMYGIGIISPKEDATAAGLGHSGIALAPSEWVNLSNPAGLSKLDSLRFYFNVQVKAFYAKERCELEKQSVYSANIDGITMAFRGKKWIAFVLGYAPYSTVGYNMNETKNIYGTEYFYRVNYKGSGGLSQAFFGTTITLFNHLSIGGNFSVIWGTIEKLQTCYFNEVVGGEDIYNSRKYSLNNIYYELGAQYDFNIGQYNNFRFGVTYAPKMWLHTSYDQVIYNDVESELQTDDSTPDRFYVPRQYGAGFTYERKKFLGTIEYKVSEWGDIENNKFREGVTFRDSYTISGGIQFSPGQPDDPFYKRMRYRVGGFYGRDYLDLTTVNLMQKGFSLGLTVPLGRSLNAITIAYDHQKRGTLSNGMVRETFSNFKIALNIREIWFMKSKFE